MMNIKDRPAACPSCDSPWREPGTGGTLVCCDCGAGVYTQPLNAARQFGYQVRRRRQERGITQSQLAAQIGVDSSAVSRIEQGTRAVPIGEVVLIATTLAVDVATLFQQAHLDVGEGIYRCVDGEGRVEIAPSVLRPVVTVGVIDESDGVGQWASLSRADAAAIVHQLVAWLESI